jgi:hypothetical protein
VGAAVIGLFEDVIPCIIPLVVGVGVSAGNGESVASFSDGLGCVDEL